MCNDVHVIPLHLHTDTCLTELKNVKNTAEDVLTTMMRTSTTLMREMPSSIRRQRGFMGSTQLKLNRTWREEQLSERTYRVHPAASPCLLKFDVDILHALLNCIRNILGRPQSNLYNQ